VTWARRSFLSACAVALLALTACSGSSDKGSADTASTDAASTSTVESTTTTSTTTTEAPTTEAPATAPTEPPTTLPAPTTASATTTAPTTEYAPVAAPIAPGKSADVPADLIEDGETLNGPLPDGVYFGTLQGFRDAPTAGISIDTGQLLTGADCEAYAQQTGQECDDDYLVKNDPEGIYTIDVTPALTITVAALDGPGTSYAISDDELRRLSDGSPPSAGAPAGFSFTPFPFLYTVDNGTVTRLEQLWTP
jgi:hypothetical protein